MIFAFVGEGMGAPACVDNLDRDTLAASNWGATTRVCLVYLEFDKFARGCFLVPLELTGLGRWFLTRSRDVNFSWMCFLEESEFEFGFRS